MAASRAWLYSADYLSVTMSVTKTIIGAFKSSASVREYAAHEWFCRRGTSCAFAAKSLTEIAHKCAHFRTKIMLATAPPGVAAGVQRSCIAADGVLTGAAAGVFGVAPRVRL